MTKAKKTSLILLAFVLIAGLAYVGYRLYQESQVEVVEQKTVSEEPLQVDEPVADTENDTQPIEDDGILSSGQFGPGERDYSASGKASFELIDGKPVLTFNEDFLVSNGPDLQVYISKNKVASGEELGDFVSLGELKKDSGSQSYTLPEDYGEYKSVVIWCRAFVAEFSSADLT